MLHLLKLLLPAILPSWNFFDIITPSPRIQFTLLTSEHENPQQWHDFRQRPMHLSFLQMLGRLFWNARWNESMFVVSCAERLLEAPSQHSEDEILTRIITDLNSGCVKPLPMNATQVQFRLVVVERHGTRLQQDVCFYSRIQGLPARDVV